MFILKNSDGTILRSRDCVDAVSLLNDFACDGGDIRAVTVVEMTEAEYAAMTTPSASEILRAEIVAELAAIDTASLRPLRAVAAGTATQFDTDKLAQFETKAAALRAELAAL